MACTASEIISCDLPSVSSMYATHIRHKVQKVIADLLTLLVPTSNPSSQGKRLQSLKYSTSHLRNSTHHEAVRYSDAQAIVVAQQALANKHFKSRYSRLLHKTTSTLKLIFFCPQDDMVLLMVILCMFECLNVITVFRLDLCLFLRAVLQPC